ncbi:hypothetical protein DXG03_004102 [Asterophora parasitica]|uniref:Mating-type protein C-terminal domain-containing protein n=1 Tax=Asterophora parasitica TaxID=117018 RepID=A0A9P7K6X0_9AGAR|nr:hypothetical protein DXG03_004102 [Asterophora parasitica]
MRATLARKAGSDSKTIDSWFIDARKRIGWNSLRKKQFANKRLDIVDAATRFFVKEDAKRSLDSTVELEFAHILKSAKELYADRFEETKLATKLDIAVKDFTPTIKAQAREDRERRRREENALAATSYPSPQRSPSRSPEPHGLTPLEQDEDLATTHEAIAGQKRRSMSPGTEDEASDNRPTKRTRQVFYLDRPLETGTSTTGLPSPSPSHKCLRRSTSPPPATDATPLPTISRKRRLSDADSQGVPKRPRGLAVGPRMHAVSDPLPMSSALIEASSIDGWFNAHFGIPTPVVVDALDESEQLDVQVFNYSIEHSDSPSSVSEALSSASNSPPSAQDVPSLVPDRFAPDTLEISTNTFHYDELFADYEEPEIVFSGSGTSLSLTHLDRR